MHFKSALLFMALLSLLLAARASAGDGVEAALVPEASMNERILSVPSAPENPVMLQVTMFSPPGPGPFPLAVMNHGSSKDQRPADQPRSRLSYATYYFLSRGYAVVLPMMRGYAGSGGRLVDHACDPAAVGLEAAQDIRAVIGAMAERRDIDGTRVVVAGQSFGGWNTLALGTLGVPGVKGLVSFSGGVIETNCKTPEANLVAAATQLGTHAADPSIWFWGDNDKIFSIPTWRGMYDRYRAAGGQAELVAYGSFMSNSHNLIGYPEGLQIFGPRLDAFLARVGLPSRNVYPQYVPMAVPPPTGYAAINDVGAVPFLGVAARLLYERFLTLPLPRALAIAPNGRLAYANGGFDPLTRALAVCSKNIADCRLYAVDNDVVWTAPAREAGPAGPGPGTVPASPPSFKGALLADPSAIPFIDGYGRDGYKLFLTYHKPRAFVIAPDGAWYASQMGSDPLTLALNDCGRLHRGCKPYAVDDRVVWTGK
jgi:dienelactone hydrolase